MSKIYFGGSRNLPQSETLAAVVQAVLISGHSVHVGCQFGADQQIIHASVQCGGRSSLFVFAVAPSVTLAPIHIQKAFKALARVRFSAGGESAPLKARYLLRSIAAFQGCQSAVFFQPGAGSLAVAREAVKAGLQVFAFNPTGGDQSGYTTPPAPIPNTRGSWSIVSASVIEKSLPSCPAGVYCWQWHNTEPIQASLF